MFNGYVVQSDHEIFTYFKIMILQDSDKLIAADTEER